MLSPYKPFNPKPGDLVGVESMTDGESLIGVVLWRFGSGNFVSYRILVVVDGKFDWRERYISTIYPFDPSP